MADWEQPPLFDFSGDEPRPLPEAPQGTLLGERLALIAEHHAVVIDMIDLAMDLVETRKPMTVRKRDQWNALADQLIDHNSPVVVFLIRVVAELAVQAQVDKQEMLRQLRKQAGRRVEEAERKLKGSGYQT